MPTVSRHWPRIPGDYAAMCSVCGVRWRRSQMKRDSMSRLLCPDDVRGRNELTLDRGNIEQSGQRSARETDTGGFDDDPGTDTPPQRLTIDDVEL